MARLETEVVVNNINGLHVRPSTAIAQESQKYQCEVSLFKSDNPDEAINAKSSLDIISSFVPTKEVLKLVVDGDDAEDALENVKNAVEAIYDYDDAHPVPG